MDDYNDVSYVWWFGYGLHTRTCRAVARGGQGALPPNDPALPPPPRRLWEFLKFSIIAGLNSDFKKFSENFSYFLYFSKNFIKIFLKSQLFLKIFQNFT